MFGYVIQPTHFSIRFLYCFPIDNRRHTYIHTKNNGLSGSNSDVVIANEKSFDLAFIYPLKCWGKKEKKKKKPNTGQQGYQQGCQQGRELSVSVVLVEQLRGGQ